MERINTENRIQRLDNLTANQIAAGEVIERPVSVVKELVENAIDAGSTKIKIEIREGGLSLIRIIDNGGGIPGQDLPLAVERHATSKLRQIQDLDDLTTLGFRGEALASIASVAALEIITRKTGEIQGHCLRVKGEEEEPVISKAGCPEGTSITVEHLFFNTPARLKFMKTPGYEGGLIHDLITQLALGYPVIDFRLENQGKMILDTAGINNTEDLVELFYGKEARQALVPIESPVSKGRLRGWITAPPYSRGTRKGFHVYVNGRRISVKDMQWSIERAFEYVLPKGRFPLAILAFQLPGELLDVNVHPGKLEIRINDPDLNPSITRTLRTAISGGQLMPDAGRLGMAAGAGSSSIAQAAKNDSGAAEAAQGGPGFFSGGSPANPGGTTAKAGGGQISFAQPVRQWETLYNFTAEGEDQLNRLVDANAFSLAEEPGGLNSEDLEAASLASPQSAYATAESQEGAAESANLFAGLEEKTAGLLPGQWGVSSHNKSMQALAADWRRADFFFGPDVEFTIIGQLHATFILAEVKAGLLVVDQHVAHERIIYERLLAKFRQKETAAQMLMQPISLNLTTGEEEVLIRHILLLNDLGLIVERFGPRQYVLRSVPAGQTMDQSMFRELLEKLAEGGGGNDLEQAKQALLIMASCKSAVKANTLLNRQEMAALLKGLQQTCHPMTCPHGRPIMYLLPYHRLIQAFGRSS